MADLTFTTIEESARHSLNISRDEYAACNYVQTWAAYPSSKTPGFCNRTRGQMAAFIGISERGMQKMLSRLEGMDLIKRASQSQFLYRITEKWFNTVVAAKAERTGEQSSQQGVNKVPEGGEQSSRKGANKVHPHKELNKEVIRSGGKSRFAPPAPAESQSLKEEEVKRGLVAQPAEAAAPTHLVKTTGPDSNGVTEVEGIALTIAPDQYPNPKSSQELKEAMRSYFVANPKEWKDGVLEQSRASNWTAEKIGDCMTAFCAYQEGEGNLKRTYGQYKGMLVRWFLSQPSFDRSKPMPGASSQQSNSPVPQNIRRL